MKKLLVLVLALCLFALGLPALAETAAIDSWVSEEAAKLSDDQKVLNVFTWEYYIPDEVVDAFMDVTGITVNYTACMGGNEEMLTKLVASPGVYDLLLCSDYIIATMTEQELLTELDKAKIPNYENIDPFYQSRFFDPENRFSIPYSNTIPLIVYNPEKVSSEITGYKDLWNPEFENSLSMLAEMRVITGVAQKKLGLSYNETDPAKLAQVKEELMALKPNVLSFNDDTPHNALISGDATAGFMFGSQIVAARQVLPDLKVVYPEEGLGFGIDNLVVPKDAPHIEATYLFLNYLLDGKVSADASGYINYGNCNLKATEFLSERYLNDDTVNVPAERTKTAEMISPLDQATQKIYDDIWVSFRQ